MNYSEYVSNLNVALSAISEADIDSVKRVIETAFQDERTVFIAGNGGSAATASHMACDFQKTTLAKEHGRVVKRIRCIALSDNMPLITAWGNDVHYDEIFGQQLRNLARPDDVLLVVSASGNSPNILKALESARELGVSTLGFLGFAGGRALAQCDHAIVVRSHDFGVIEDAHSVLMHMITAALRATVLA